MPSAPSSSAWSRYQDLVLPATIVGAVLVFIVPVPPIVLDLLLSANITLAVLVLLTVLAIRTPLEFAAFPTLLLTTTLMRLVLNVATVRLVLTRGGEHGLEAAGGVIRAFGEFVASDQVVVGAILFAILVVIQFVVITKGATRISEVAARFMLDGLPGRQMAIDADLHAGLIDQAEAVKRRDALYRQADFFGAMDGAGKFVRGDAVAGVIITFVNILGGLYMGAVVHGMPLGEAVDVFTKLTIGDGLVTQVPAFLVSLAAGLIVTRSTAESRLGHDVVGQLTGRAEVLAVAALFLFALSFTSLPKLPLWALAGTLAAGAYLKRPRGQAHAQTGPIAPTTAEPVENVPVSAPPPPGDEIDELLHVDLLELEIGYRLIPLADLARGGDLLDRIRGVRQRVARELGLIVPQVRVRDELGLGPHEYRLKIRGAVVGQGTAYATRLLAVPPPGLVTRPEGRDGVDPTSGQPAVWIHADGREVATLAGCKVFETSAVIALHFGEMVMLHADELMTHDQVARWLERTRATASGLVDEVVPGLLRAGEVQRVLQGLLRERVSIRDAETVLEALAEHAVKTRDTDLLLEHVRRALGRQITQQYRGPDGHLHAVALGRSLDSRLAVAGQDRDDTPSSLLGPEACRAIVRAVAHAVAPLLDADLPPVVVCSPEARPVLKDVTRSDLPRLIVLGQREVPRDVPLEIVGAASEEEVLLMMGVTA